MICFVVVVVVVVVVALQASETSDILPGVMCKPHYVLPIKLP